MRFLSQVNWVFLSFFDGLVSGDILSGLQKFVLTKLLPGLNQTKLKLPKVKYESHIICVCHYFVAKHYFRPNNVFLKKETCCVLDKIENIENLFDKVEKLSETRYTIFLLPQCGAKFIHLIFWFDMVFERYDRFNKRNIQLNFCIDSCSEVNTIGGKKYPLYSEFFRR